MLITRYLIRNLLIVTAFVVVTLTAVIWLTQSLKLLEIVASSDAPPSLFLKLVILSLPRFLEIILPLSLVIAVLFTYNRLTVDNELIVMRACGINHLSLARPALVVAGVLTLILLSLTSYISPKSTGQLIYLRETVKAQYSAFLLREGVFNTFGDDLTVYLRRRDSAGDLYGLMIHDTRDKEKPPVTITAKKGRIVMDGELPTIIVYDGMRHQMDRRKNALTKLYFSKYTIEIKNFGESGFVHWREANERTLTELLQPDMTDERERLRKDAFLAEFHRRILSPFNALGFTAIALSVLLLGSFNRRGQRKKILAAALLVVAMQSTSLLTINAMKTHFAAVYLLYAFTLLPPAGALYLLSFRGEQTLMSTLRNLRRKQTEALA
ncbi:MAG: LPS export ABC transporter permease LptF [Alphaproteobacteria bacterium]|nr:LPS export ABC transporter permease LptF [Alphaproteobacteria bacterium]